MFFISAGKPNRPRKLPLSNGRLKSALYAWASQAQLKLEVHNIGRSVTASYGFSRS